MISKLHNDFLDIHREHKDNMIKTGDPEVFSVLDTQVYPLIVSSDKQLQSAIKEIQKDIERTEAERKASANIFDRGYYKGIIHGLKFSLKCLVKAREGLYDANTNNTGSSKES